MTKTRFALHYIEMVVAMFVGMFALAPLWPSLEAYPAAEAMAMTVNMSVGMAAWMLVRKHSWPHIAEMCAAMAAPFLVLLIPYGMGLVDGGTLMLAGHLLMFPAMLVPMLLRRHGSTAARPGSAAPRPTTPADR
ncbi:hypothetical protein ACFY36_04780 [Actinoplanes sp. NPDC000266]